MRQRLALVLFAWATGLMFFLGGAEARADMCFGGGHRPPPAEDAGHKEVAAESAPGKRNLGLGFLAAASVGSVWLSFRRRNPGKRDE